MIQFLVEEALLEKLASHERALRDEAENAAAIAAVQQQVLAEVNG